MVYKMGIVKEQMSTLDNRLLMSIMVKINIV